MTVGFQIADELFEQLLGSLVAFLPRNSLARTQRFEDGPILGSAGPHAERDEYRTFENTGEKKRPERETRRRSEERHPG